MSTILALDPGERRTGLAISDAEGILASPLPTHDRRRHRSLLETVAELCAEHDVGQILVGYPLTQMGEHGSSAQRSSRLAERLRARLSVPVDLVDERFSTAEAKRLLAGKKRSREDRDALAAVLILQAYLDARRGRPGADE
jgi:putative Holliday junction resolvase